MKLLKFIFFWFLTHSLNSYAQYPNILISNTNEPEEVSIAINPKNTKQIIAGANINNQYKSNDGGLTWLTSILSCNEYNVGGDPVVFWDTASNAFFMHLSNPNPSITPGGTWVDRIVIQKSTDFGTTYPICKGVGKNGSKVQDKPWYVVNPFDNSIHITWTQFDKYESSLPTDSSHILYSNSKDGGLSWSKPFRINKKGGNCMDNDTTVEGAVPAIGPNGEVYVVWASIDGLNFQKSLDNGLTWLAAETLIGKQIGGWVYDINGIFRCNGLPFTNCDLSNGPFKGNIYVNYSDQTNGANDIDVFIIKSSDGGLTWSSPIRVNDDAPGKNQFMSCMTVDKITGYIYILFYDRRNYINNDFTDVYLAISKDGGNTFTNHKVNQKAFNPTPNIFFGDYIGISAHNNSVKPIWMQLNNNSLSIYTANIDELTINGKDNFVNKIVDIQQEINLQSSKNNIDFSTKIKTKITIQLLNNKGDLINEIVTKKTFKKGINKISLSNFKLNLNTGIYYLVFYGNEKSNYTKLIIN